MSNSVPSMCTYTGFTVYLRSVNFTPKWILLLLVIQLSALAQVIWLSCLVMLLSGYFVYTDSAEEQARSQSWTSI